MAKAALEMAVLDAELRVAGRSFAEHLGAVVDRVPAGVSVGITDTVAELLDQVAGYLDDGYVRIKLKIEPGRRHRPRRRGARALRRRPQAAGRRQRRLLARRRRPPRPARRLRPAARSSSPSPPTTCATTRLLAKRMRTPICLDESITVGQGCGRRHRPRRLLDRQHQGRAGRRLSRGQASARHVPGARRSRLVRRDARDRASDGRPISPSPRFPGSPCPATRRRRTATGSATSPSRSCSTSDGHVAVPSGPGLGVEPLPDVLAEVTTSSRWLRR